MLFAGIFVTMVPALELLQRHGGELGVTRAVAVLLADRRPVVVPGQRADVPDLRHAGAGGQRIADAGVGDESAATCCDGDQLRRGVHGGEHLHRQRAELHGQGDRRRGGLPDAVVLRLHGYTRA